MKLKTSKTRALASILALPLAAVGCDLGDDTSDLDVESEAFAVDETESGFHASLAMGPLGQITMDAEQDGATTRLSIHGTDVTSVATVALEGGNTLSGDLAGVSVDELGSRQAPIGDDARLVLSVIAAEASAFIANRKTSEVVERGLSIAIELNELLNAEPEDSARACPRYQTNTYPAVYEVYAAMRRACKSGLSSTRVYRAASKNVYWYGSYRCCTRR